MLRCTQQAHPEDNNYYYYVAMPDGSRTCLQAAMRSTERNIEASNQALAQAAKRFGKHDNNGGNR